MKLKKFFLLVLMLGFATFLQAQRVGITAGIGAYKPSVKLNNGEKRDMRTGFGYVMGITASSPLSHQTEIRPALELSSRRSSEERSQYLDLSLPVVRTWATAQKGGWLAGAGPTVNIPIRGYSGSGLDVGLCGTLGHDFPSGVSFNLRYTLNLRDRVRDPDLMWKNRFAVFAVSYFF